MKMKINIKLLVIDRGKIDIYLKNIYLNWCYINFLKYLLKFLHRKVQQNGWLMFESL